MKAKQKYVVRGNRNPNGPFTEVELREYYEQGILTADAECWRDGFRAWKPVVEILGISRQETSPSPASASDGDMVDVPAWALKGLNRPENGKAFEKAIINEELPYFRSDNRGTGTYLMGKLWEPCFGNAYVVQRCQTLLWCPIAFYGFYVFKKVPGREDQYVGRIAFRDLRRLARGDTFGKFYVELFLRGLVLCIVCCGVWLLIKAR